MIIPHSRTTACEGDFEAVRFQIEKGMHATKDKVTEFQKKMCDFIGRKYAVSASTGTTALQLALESLNLKKDDEVILPSYVCQSVMNSVLFAGARPVLADIDDDFLGRGYNISKKTIMPLINKKTKAIIVPHMFGTPAEIDKIKALGITIIEDCAQSLGGNYNGEKIGRFGDLAVFSFYATKVISTGHGGMILTDSKKLKENLDDLTCCDKREEHKKAHNFGFTDIQAALGINQLAHISDLIKRREEIEKKYNDSLKNISEITIPRKIDGSFPFRYVIALKDRKERKLLQNKLAKKGIASEQPIFKPLHQYLNLLAKDFPNSEKAHEIALSLPIYPSLKDEEVNFVINSVREVFAK